MTIKTFNNKVVIIIITFENKSLNFFFYTGSSLSMVVLFNFSLTFGQILNLMVGHWQLKYVFSAPLKAAIKKNEIK